MIYVVLGMHKSGTTLVSRLMHHAGVEMVESVPEGMTYESGSKYERIEAQELNDDILGSTGIQSIDIPRRTPWELTRAQRERMEGIVDACAAKGGDWGFKDPRTCLTYPLWADVLPPHRLVVVYRSPHEVWRRYRPKRRRDVPLKAIFAWRFLRVWCAHNKGILSALDRHKSPAIVLEYGRLMSDPDEFQRLSRFLGRPLRDERRPDLYRNRVDRDRLIELASTFYRWVYGYHPYSIVAALDQCREQTQMSYPNAVHAPSP